VRCTCICINQSVESFSFSKMQTCCTYIQYFLKTPFSQERMVICLHYHSGFGPATSNSSSPCIGSNDVDVSSPVCSAANLSSSLTACFAIHPSYDDINLCIELKRLKTTYLFPDGSFTSKAFVSLFLRLGLCHFNNSPI
jgi:hypothetical protein